VTGNQVREHIMLICLVTGDADLNHLVKVGPKKSHTVKVLLSLSSIHIWWVIVED
jgi:hypothetical protein